MPSIHTSYKSSDVGFQAFVNDVSGKFTIVPTKGSATGKQILEKSFPDKSIIEGNVTNNASITLDKDDKFALEDFMKKYEKHISNFKEFKGQEELWVKSLGNKIKPRI